MVHTIDDKTRIPLFAVATALPVILGGVISITLMYAKVNAQEVNLQKQQEKIDQQMIVLLDIRDKVIRLETSVSKK